MKLKTNELISFLENKKEDIVWLFFKNDTKLARTEAQKRTFELLFSIINKHQGYHRDEIKIFFLIGCFGQKPFKMGNKEVMIPSVGSTMGLSKEQGIFLISTILEYIKIHDIPFELESGDLKSLYECFN